MNLEIITEEINLPDCHEIARYADMTDDQWHEYRATGLGGSEAGGLMGLSKYSSPLTIAMEKTGRIPREDISDEEPIKMGNLMEPLIRNHIIKPVVLDRMGINVEVIEPVAMYRSNKYPWMIINTDGFLKIPQFIKAPENLKSEKLRVDDKLVGLEIKNRSSYMMQYYGGKDGTEVMDTDYCQVQWYMAGTGLEEFWVFAMIGNIPVIRIVPRNDDFIANLIEEGQKLWNIIQENNILNFPAPNGSDADQRVIDHMGRPQSEEAVDIPQDEHKIIRHSFLGKEIKSLTAERKKLQQEILMDMGIHKYGETDNMVCTMSRFQKTLIDGKRLRLEKPEIAEEYSNTTESGRFSVKER